MNTSKRREWLFRRKRDKGLRFPDEDVNTLTELAKLAAVDKKLILTNDALGKDGRLCCGDAEKQH